MGVRRHRKTTFAKVIKRAVIYCRVSTSEQADRGYSLREQEERLRRYCQIQGYEVVAHFQDDASAKSFDRPKFQQFLREVGSRRIAVDIVLIVKWDRFSRNANDAYNMIDRLAKYGIEVRAIDQTVDMTVPESKLMLALYLTTPEVENDRRSMSTVAGMRRAMKEGRWTFRPPKGYTRAVDPSVNGGKTKLVPNADARFIVRAFEERAKNLRSTQEILRELQRDGFNCSHNQICLLLENDLYRGKILIPAWGNEEEELVMGVHEAIVTDELFLRVQSVINEKRGHRYGKQAGRDPMLPLRGWLVCRQCGGNLTGGPCRSATGKSYWYYNCQRRECRVRFRADAANADFVQYLRRIQIRPEIAELYLAVLNDLIEDREGTRQSKVQGESAKLAELEERLTSIENKFFDNQIEASSYRRLKEDAERKIEEQTSRLRLLEGVEGGLNQYARFGISLLSSLEACFSQADVPVQQKFLSLVFPQKLLYENREYRTLKPNDITALLEGRINESGGENERTDPPFDESVLLGSAGKIRTYNPPINSRMLHH